MCLHCHAEKDGGRGENEDISSFQRPTFLPSFPFKTKQKTQRQNTYISGLLYCMSVQVTVGQFRAGGRGGGGMGGGVCLRVRAPMEMRVLENSCAYARMHCSLFSFALFMDKIDEAFGVSCGVFLRPVNEI